LIVFMCYARPIETNPNVVSVYIFQNARLRVYCRSSSNSSCAQTGYDIKGSATAFSDDVVVG